MEALKRKRWILPLIMGVQTIFCMALLFCRLHKSGFSLSDGMSITYLSSNRGATFLFLAWNLFLAWIPYLLALSLKTIQDRPRALIGLTLLLWLLFLPNAPYIITDLLHLRQRPLIPLWFDTLLLFSFAWTGLLLGLLSMLEVQNFLEQKIGKIKALMIPAIILPLSGLGIYIGRVNRWNSWDILFHPIEIFQDIFTILIHPFSHGLALVLMGLLSISYFLFFTLTRSY